MYDWANSAFMVVIITAIFPIYFSSVAAANLAPEVATFRFTVATTIGLAIIAALSPLLGTIADYAGAKKKLLAGFMLLGVAAVGMMFFIQRGDWLLAALLFILANIGANGSFVFYDSLLPHVARPDEINRVCPGVSGIRTSARTQPCLDPETGMVWIPPWSGDNGGRGHPSHPVGVPFSGHLVDPVFTAPAPTGPGAAQAGRAGRGESEPAERRLPAAGGNVPAAPGVSQRFPHARRVPHLQ
jgi:hypothetical protein